MEEKISPTEVSAPQTDKPAEKEKKTASPRMGKIAILLLVILLAAFAVSERLKRTATEQRLASVLQERQQLQTEVGELTRIKDNLGMELTKERQEAEILAERLAEEKQIREATLVRLNEMERRLGSVDNAEELFARMDELEEENEEIRSRLERIRNAKEALEARIVGKPSGRGVVNLSKVTIRKESASGPRVLVVNRKFDFVVVNMGDKDGIKTGDILTIYRKDKFIAKVKVEEVHEAMSAAAVLPEWRKYKIKVNDGVKLL